LRSSYSIITYIDYVKGTGGVNPKPENLIKLKTVQMPYGRHKGTILINLPETYVLWLCEHALPEGQLGELVKELYEIKVNGLESLVRSL